MTRVPKFFLGFALAAAVAANTTLKAADGSDQTTFAAPEDAVQALVESCAHNRTSALLKIFGPEGKDIVESGDRTDDKSNRKMFARLAREKKALIPDPQNVDKMILSIGDQDWPFPVPLVRKDGRWYFDSAQGLQEILARRIGDNEISAIEVCRGYVEAQMEYAQNHRTHDVPTYAQKIVSSSGQQDGLYWPSAKGVPDANVPQGFAHAAAELATKSWDPYHGYYFKVLAAQGADARGGAANYIVQGSMIGGFALVAWPAQYGVSGIKTFLVNHDGTVYEKDLGDDSAKAASAFTEYNPDASWQPVQPE